MRVPTVLYTKPSAKRQENSVSFSIPSVSLSGDGIKQISKFEILELNATRTFEINAVLLA